MPRYAYRPLSDSLEWRPLRVDWLDPDDEADPELAVVVYPTGAPYTVSVELRRHSDGAWFVIGIAVRRQYPWWEEPSGWEASDERWASENPHVSPRDVQRLPLARIVRAALAAASSAERPNLATGKPAASSVARIFAEDGITPPQEAAWAQVAQRVLLPRGRPQRGKSVDFYRELANSYRALARTGVSPPKVIARRKRVSTNTVYQWLYRARDLGFLELPPGSKRRRRADAE